jgi:hypothetical protein
VPNAVFAVGCSFVGAGGAACKTDLPNFAPSEPPVPVWAFLYVAGQWEPQQVSTYSPGPTQPQQVSTYSPGPTQPQQVSTCRC